MPSDSGSAWSPPAGSGERRLSNSSDGSAGSGYSKAVSTDSGEYVRTRTTVAAGARPPVNPLQFVKVGPCDLYRSAQEQLKRAEEVKKSKEVKKEEQEDWQSNLDNWKSSRRKRVEHIIERCVEVKKMENEPVPGARAKNKTFNEMLEERAGKRRRCPLNLYTEEEVTDLSDLGIGTSSTKSSLSEDCDTHSLTSDGVEGDKNHSDIDTISNCDNTSRKQVLSSNEYDTCTTTTISSPEPEEYTYEGAIEGYKSRIISQTHTNIINTQYKSYSNNKYEEPEQTAEKTAKSDINFIRTTVSNKIEAKVTSFQQTRQNSITEITKSRKDLPKVDVLKRRELFEKESSPETFSLSKNRSSTDLANPKSIKERLSNLEKYNEENHQKSSKDLNKIPVEVASIKDRLTSLEKVKSSGVEVDKTKRLSNGDLAKTRSIKERLSNFKSQLSEDESKLVKTEVKEVSQSLKERLSSLDAARNKEIVRQTSDIDFNVRNDKEDKSTQRDDKKEEFIVSSNRSSISGLELQMQNFCRSLDSLDINDGSMHSPFERVQSLEDFDTCREPLNNTTPSDIETEDSGVHTAHGSCAVSQVDETAESVDLQTVEILAEEQEARDISEPELSNDDMCSKLSVPESPLPPEVPQYDSHVDTDDDKIDESEDTSSKEFHQALSQVDDEISATEDTTEIHLDKEDEDTVKSLDNHDTSVIDALELAFKEIDSEDSSDSIEEGKQKMSDSQVEKQENGYFNAPKQESSKGVEIPPVVEAKVKQLETLASSISINESKPAPFTKKDDMIPLYENIEIFYQNGGAFPMTLNGDSVSEVDALILDLPSHAMEPPKEKPPPPPVEDNVEDELLGNGNFKSTNSTRRIKKEIRNKRSSFLGIEGQLDDSYLDTDLKLTPRPDITSFLQEESRVEKMLFKKTLNHDKDSTLHQSRDSGVDLDRGHTADWLNKQISSPEDSSNNHSRQNSEPYTITVTSDEEEMALKQERSKQHMTPTDGYQDTFNENLTNKLENLQKESSKNQYVSPPDSVHYERARINNLEKKIHEQQEVLRFERELLQLEQEELKRQRDNLLIRETRTRRKLQNQSVQDVSTLTNSSQYINGEMSRQRPQSSHRHSMPNLLVNQDMYVAPKPNERTVFAVMEDVTVPERSPRKPIVLSNFVNKLPPPVPPSKPRSIESQEREISMRSSRVPSAVEYPSVQLRQKSVPNGQVNSQQYHPMSRHTLQVLSAAPTSKLISGSDWLQVKRRKQPPPAGYNYNQHWLIQEAEQRRIEEQRNNARQRFQQPATNQRQSYQPNTTVPTQRLQSINPRTPDIAGSKEHLASVMGQVSVPEPVPPPGLRDSGEKMLSVSGRKKCSHCGEELGRGAAMIIESLSLCYHVWCFACVVCGTRLGDGRAGADVRVRARRLHCHQCYSSEDGRKFSCV